MPPLEILIGALLALLYSCLALGVYALLRRCGFGCASALGIGVPLCQAVLSAIFQIRFLSGSVWIGLFLTFVYLGCTAWILRNERLVLHRDLHRVIDFVKERRWIAVPLIGILVYSLAQVLLLPVKNHDALAYHLPRIFLFSQQNTFFLDNFSLYHEVIFPVGADLLFYPFVALGTARGLAIFSFSSYLAIGASAYAVSRHFTDPRRAVLCGLSVIGLSLLVLQSVTVKNDIIMAGIGAATLVLLVRPASFSHRRLLLAALLCAFGVSAKSTFIALLPGLVLLATYQFKLFNPAQVRRLIATAIADRNFSIFCIVGSLLVAPLWLFAWNAAQYETWSGPPEFTERHQQHDGLSGTLANSARYGLQILQIGSISDTLCAHILGTQPFSRQLNEFYSKTIEPVFGSAGATREAFGIQWIHHEDWAWFGPLGAFMVFVCVPASLLRNPRTLFFLLPAIGFFLIIAWKISWMPWNGRFFSTFFVTLTPALAISLDGIRSRKFLSGLAFISIASLFIVKTVDFSRPLFPIAKDLYTNKSANPLEVVRSSLDMRANAWSQSYLNRELHQGSPSSLLKKIEPGAAVGIYLNGHIAHYGFYAARPDLVWYPLNHIRGLDTIDFRTALNIFSKSSELDYLLLLGIYSPNFAPYLVAASKDGVAYLIANPRGMPVYSEPFNP